MKPQNPANEKVQNLLLTLRSIYRVLVGNVSFGSADTYASDGSVATYTQDNTDGVLIRVGPNANPLGLPTFWAGTNVDTTIVHNLLRVPVGYIVCKKSMTCDIYDGTIVATETEITLKNTDGTADTIIYIF